MHLFSLADPNAPAKLSTTHACDTDITALSFGPCPADCSVPLLAVGSKRGGVRLLQLGGSAEWHRRASCSPSGAGSASSTVLASITDHKGAVTGLALACAPDGGCLHLTTCGADGRQLTYSWDAAARQLRPVAQAAVPRASFAGLVHVQADQGPALVAATKAGRISWEDGAGQEAVLQVLDKRQGGLTGAVKAWAHGASQLHASLTVMMSEPFPPTTQLPLLVLPCRRTGCICCGPLALSAGGGHQPQHPAPAPPGGAWRQALCKRSGLLQGPCCRDSYCQGVQGMLQHKPIGLLPGTLGSVGSCCHACLTWPSHPNAPALQPLLN